MIIIKNLIEKFEALDYYIHNFENKTNAILARLNTRINHIQESLNTLNTNNYKNQELISRINDLEKRLQKIV